MAGAGRRAAPGRGGDGGRLAGHAIELVDGERIEYGRLALATGSTPRPLEAAETIRTIEDSQRVGALLERGSGHVAVIGGGFIGVEVAASARMKGLDVTLVVPERGALGPPVRRPRSAPTSSATWSDTACASSPAGTALPDDLEADMVVAGIGVSPNVELAQNAGRPDATPAC